MKIINDTKIETNIELFSDSEILSLYKKYRNIKFNKMSYSEIHKTCSIPLGSNMYIYIDDRLTILTNEINKRKI